MPVLARARQAAHLDTQHEADVVQADLGQEPLEPQPAFSGRRAAALVLVDDEDPLLRPAQRDRSLRQGVLKLLRLAIARDLLRSRLANVNDRQALEVAGP